MVLHRGPPRREEERGGDAEVVEDTLERMDPAELQVDGHERREAGDRVHGGARHVGAERVGAVAQHKGGAVGGGGEEPSDSE
eukprot:scaffold91892_cov26-Tisochrysis_lutea.AAC.1